MISCDINYQYNYQINNRKPPIVIVAIDTTTNTVLMRDGDNKIFTIYNNHTTKAIVKSLKPGDTIRSKSINIFYKNF